jgi:O-antigen/teichoic acid export membrane protein
MLRGDDREVFSKHVDLTLYALAVVFFPLVCGVWVVHRQLLQLVAGDLFADVSPLLGILVSMCIAQSLIVVFGQLVLQIKRRNLLYNVHLLLGLIGGVVAMRLAYPTYGIYGIASAVFIVKLAIGMSLYAFAKAYLNPLNWLRLAKVAFAAFAMFSILYIANLPDLFLNVLGGALLYVSFVIMVSHQELRMLISKMRS